MRFACLLFLLLFGAPHRGGAQEVALAPAKDTTLLQDRIAGITVTESLSHYNATRHRFSADSLRALGLPDGAAVLRRIPGLFVRQAAPGQLATLSYRGGNASQTAIFWNGIPLDSPQLGLTDLSFLSTAAFDQLVLAPGGNTAANGSGAVSGAIDIVSGGTYGEGWRARTTHRTGSFGQLDNALDVGYGGNGNHSDQHWSTRTRLYRRFARNDFRFRALPDLPIQTQTHARTAMSGWVQNSSYSGYKYGAQLALWHQRADRQLPALTTQRRSEATQADRQWRVSLHPRIDLGEATRLSLLSGYVRDRIDYRDPLVRLVAPSGSTQYFQQVRSLHTDYLGRTHYRYTIEATYRYQYFRATADGYPNGVSESRHALGARAELSTEDWSVELALRQGLVDGQRLPFTPALSGAYRLGAHWSVDAQVAYTYRYPTLNDRFWEPGGRAELRPENGWSQTAGLTLRAGGWHYRLAAYHRLLRDWILWAPAPGSFVFTASNLARVRSYGLEQSARRAFTVGERQRLILGGQYSFARSANLVALSVPRIGAGEQLFYTPRHQAAAHLEYRLADWSARLETRYTGSVLGINADLPSYWLTDLRLGRNLTYERFGGRATLGFYNLFDVWYQAVERRPAPGRYLDLSIQINFQQYP